MRSVPILLCVLPLLLPAVHGYDCNGNGIADELEIQEGAVPDCNDNNVPDSCDLMPPMEVVPGPQYPARFHPFDVVLADLNADEILDVVTANHDSGDVTIRFGKGDGTFGASQLVATGERPRDVLAVDVDTDGKVDLITANSLSRDISIHYGRGSGQFEAPRKITVDGAATGVLAEDLDGDGLRDIAVGVSSTPYGVHVFLGSGGRNFELLDVFDTPRPSTNIASGDFDGNDTVDLLVSGEGTMVLFGRGDGTFQPALRLGGSRARNAAAGDVNGDEVLDIVAPLRSSSVITIILGRGEGLFAEPTEYEFGSQDPVDVVIEDMDGDDVLDVAVVSNDDSLSLLRGIGDGSFASTFRLSVPGGPWSVALGDVDGDRAYDLATANSRDDSVSILLGLNSAPVSSDDNDNQVPDECDGVLQRPGDCNQDGGVDISDALCVFGVLFAGQPERFPCGDGSALDNSNIALIDWQPDDRIDVSDGIALLQFLFAGGPPHASSGERCTRLLGCPEVAECHSI